MEREASYCVRSQVMEIFLKKLLIRTDLGKVNREQRQVKGIQTTCYLTKWYKNNVEKAMKQNVTPSTFTRKIEIGACKYTVRDYKDLKIKIIKKIMFPKYIILE